jgi:plasmid maintenance system antidote protein VapI
MTTTASETTPDRAPGTVPALVLPVGEFIADELRERGWTIDDLAKRMPGDRETNNLTLELLIHAPMRGAVIGQETAEALGSAFGTSATLWERLDAMWQNAPAVPAERSGARHQPVVGGTVERQKGECL